jgi:hypothetical protein
MGIKGFQTNDPHASRRAANMISAIAEPTDALTDTTVLPEIPKVRFWAGVVRDFPDLTTSEVAVVQAVYEFPSAGDAEIGEKVRLSASQVSRIKNSERFMDVLMRFGMARNDLFTLKTGRADELILDSLLADLQTRGVKAIDGDRLRFLELCNKRAGLLQPDQHLHLHKHGNDTAAVDQVTDLVDRVLSGFEAEITGQTVTREANVLEVNTSTVSH